MAFTVPSYQQPLGPPATYDQRPLVPLTDEEIQRLLEEAMDQLEERPCYEQLTLF